MAGQRMLHSGYREKFRQAQWLRRLTLVCVLVRGSHDRVCRKGLDPRSQRSVEPVRHSQQDQSIE